MLFLVSWSLSESGVEVAGRTARKAEEGVSPFTWAILEVFSFSEWGIKLVDAWKSVES